METAIQQQVGHPPLKTDMSICTQFETLKINSQLNVAEYCERRKKGLVSSLLKMFCLVVLSNLVFCSSALSIEKNPFLSIESIFVKPKGKIKIENYTLNVFSYSKPFQKNSVRYLGDLDKKLVYTTKINLKNKIYYRLVSGNYKTQKEAQAAYEKIKMYYPDAWINYRTEEERKGLIQILPLSQKSPILPAVGLTQIKPSPQRKKAKKSTVVQPNKKKKLKKTKPPASLSLLEQAKQAFLSGDYPKVLTIIDKVMDQGDNEKIERAMELSGIVRERQGNFEAAIEIYASFLELYPDSKLSLRVNDRLIGLRTMTQNPKNQITTDNQRSPTGDWQIGGAISQFYWNETIETENIDKNIVNSSWITDINLFAHHKTDTSALLIQFDGGFSKDVEADKNRSRISRARVNYINNISKYEVIGGRQAYTAKGVFGKFDGLVFNTTAKSNYNYGISIGSPVQSSADSIDSDRQFVGTSLNIKLFKKTILDIYLLQQKVSGLVDREAIGTEIQFRSSSSAFYGVVDYDMHFNDLNNVTAIGNLRYNDRLSLNMSYDFRNSPLLSTSNALQGQTVRTISELENLFSATEIYQLAQDRTSKNQNLFLGSSYQIDNLHQLHLNMFLSSTKATVESGGVAAIPASDDVHFSLEYTIQDFFLKGDYSSLGGHLSSTTSADVFSIRTRTRLPGTGNMYYDPRLRLDYRISNTSDIEQWIINPSIKLSYKPDRNLSIEAKIGVEYSDYNLPELSDQKAYSFYLGYLYFF